MELARAQCWAGPIVNDSGAKPLPCTPRSLILRWIPDLTVGHFAGTVGGSVARSSPALPECCGMMPGVGR